ncbi:oligosaccharide flippase family protein [Vibrio harveyi]|nr:oligosaccharide flippase family protein [Vibrio harveyi]
MNGLLKKSLNASIILAILTCFQYLIGLFAQSNLAKNLSQENFGEAAIIVMIVLFFISMSNLSSDKFLYKESKNVLSEVVIIELLLSLLFLLLGWYTIDYILSTFGVNTESENYKYLLLLCFYNPLSRVRAIHEKEIDFLKARWAYVVGQITAPLIGMYFLKLDAGIYSILIWKLSGLVIEVLLLNIFNFKLYNKPCFKSFNYSSYLRLCLPLQLSVVLVYIYSNVDYAIISSLVSVEQLGGYWLAFQFTNQILQSRKILISVASPSFNKIDKKKAVLSSARKINFILVLFFSIPLFIMLCFGKEFIELIFGSQWLEFTNIFTVFCVVLVFRGASTLIEPLCIRFDKTKIMLYTTVITTLITIFLGFLFTKYYEATGMAYAILTSSFVSVCFGYIMLCYYDFDIGIKNMLMNILCVLLFVFVFSELLEYLSYNTGFFEMVCFTIVYILFLITFGYVSLAKQKK